MITTYFFPNWTLASLNTQSGPAAGIAGISRILASVVSEIWRVGKEREWMWQCPPGPKSYLQQWSQADAYRGEETGQTHITLPSHPLRAFNSYQLRNFLV